MAISYLRLKNNSALLFCLSSDVKPTASAGFLLHETDTGKTFYVSASAWQEVSGGGGSGLTQQQTEGLI